MRALNAAALAVSLVLAGCSGDTQTAETAEPSGPSAGVVVEDDGTQVLTLLEDDSYRFDPEEPHVTTGPLRIDMVNQSTQTTHSLAFKPGGPDVGVPFINPGQKVSISMVINTPGEYQFFCTFHEALGQSGVLVVTDP